MVKKLLGIMCFLFLATTLAASPPSDSNVVNLQANLWALRLHPMQGGGQFGGGSSGGTGTVTNVSGTANQIDVATGTTTPVISLDPAFQFSSTAAGALTTAPFLFTGNPVTGGTGTTTVPLFYFNGGTAPTTWSTSGTYIGINAVSGFAGNFLDFHSNGGASLVSINSAGQIITTTSMFIGTTSSYLFSSHGGLSATADGAFKLTNTAFNGLNRLILGNDTTGFPAVCPNGVTTQTVPELLIGVGGANCTTLAFTKTAQTLQVTGADVTCGTSGTLTPCTSFTTITGLSVALPTVATTWSFDCDLIVSQATGAVADQIGVQTSGNASTNLAASGIAYTAAAVSTAAAFTGVSSTASQSIVTFTPGATGTKLPVHISGTVEGTSTSGTTFNLQVLTGNASDNVTIYRGSACYLR